MSRLCFNPFSLMLYLIFPSTDEDFREYINTLYVTVVRSILKPKLTSCSYLSGASEGELDSIEALYPQDPTQVSLTFGFAMVLTSYEQGSPFDTGTANTLTLVKRPLFLRRC